MHDDTGTAASPFLSSSFKGAMCPRYEGKSSGTRWFALRQAGITCDSIGVDLSSVEFREGEDDDGAAS